MISHKLLWGADEGERKLCPIQWNVVSTPKGEGGLGILSLKESNESLLVKLA